MEINSLEQMEQIVENNEALSWDGWTVVHSKPSATAWLKATGAFVNGKWYEQKRFVPGSKGWKLPAKLLTNAAL